VNIRVFENKVLLAQAAAADAATVIRTSIRNQGKARIIAATGASQFEFLDELTRAAGIDWTKVEMFHLDEYLGLPLTHPASFRKYLLERLVSKTGITQYHLLDGMRNPAEVMAEVNAEIRKAPIDVAFVGVGENGHLAFNDPPADFETEQPYIVVELDDACRKQQLGEGWFQTLEEVPRRAISMTVKQILKAKQIICIVPDLRKAQAVAACFGDEEVSPDAPASILRNHPSTTVYADRDSASRLRPQESTSAGFNIR
jgi:glucosamine-6-phosphate deaminase